MLDDGSADGTAAIAAARGARVLTGDAAAAGMARQAVCVRAARRGRHAARRAGVPRRGRAAVPGRDRRRGRAARDEPGSTWFRRTRARRPDGRRAARPTAAGVVDPDLPAAAAGRAFARGRPLAAANGQFLVVRRAAYERAGGHVPDAVLDDLALLRAVKRTGGRGALVDGTDLATLPDVPRLGRGARRLREVAVVGVRITGRCRRGARRAWRWRTSSRRSPRCAGRGSARWATRRRCGPGDHCAAHRRAAWRRARPIRLSIAVLAG